MATPDVTDLLPLVVRRTDAGKVEMMVQQEEGYAIVTMSDKTALWLAGQLMKATNTSMLLTQRDGEIQ